MKRLFFLLFLVPICLFSQEQTTAYGVQLSSGFSFSGFNAMLGVERQANDHRLSLAYKSLLSESAFFESLQHGLSLGYGYTLLEEKKWTAGLNVTVMQSFSENGSRIGEYLIGQELNLRISPTVTIRQQLSAGMYEETIKSQLYDLEVWNFGMNGFFSLGAVFRLGKTSE